MPLFLIAAGAVLMISAVRGTLSSADQAHPGLVQLLQSDFTGQNNFIIWIAAIGGLGAAGYIKAIQPVANALLVLVVLVLFLSNKGFFQQFTSAVLSSQTAGNAGNQTNAGQPLNVSSSLTGFTSAVTGGGVSQPPGASAGGVFIDQPGPIPDMGFPTY